MTCPYQQQRQQVVRTDGIAVGTLLQRMARNRSTSSPQSVPHWKVAIRSDGDSSPDSHSDIAAKSEDVSEHMLGRVLEPSSLSSSLNGVTVVTTTSHDTSSSPSVAASAAGSGKMKKTKGGKTQKTVTIVAPAPPTPPPTAASKQVGGRKRSAGATKAKKGKKSKTKYTKKDAKTSATIASTTSSNVTSSSSKATTKVGTSGAIAASSTKSSPRTGGARAGTRSNAVHHPSSIDNMLLTGIDDIILNGRLPPAIAAQKKKQVQQSKKKEQRQLRHMAVGDETTTVNKYGETVVKVKLLTGTLYIYKGNADGTAKRRAEFVRSK